MEKTLLIAGKEYPFCQDFVHSAVDNGDKVMVTVLDSKQKVSNAAASFVWNRSSPISARALVLETETKFGPVDSAFLVFDTALYVNDFDKMNTQVVSRGMDTLFAGYMYLTLELLERFSKTKKGSLCFVIKKHPSLQESLKTQNRTDTPPSGPFVEAAAAAFKAFAESIATKYATSPTAIHLVECPASIDDAIDLYPWLIPYVEASSENPVIEAKQAARWVHPGAKPAGKPLFRR